ncbi:PIF1-like helicase [Medicago truncatula]|uniref:ATP-dependent DNA helicase n=1 Tax=Medicago truncatula TaxID=3880 RepID=A0A072UTS2_MEDTR|nr:PIF1-like helicase [Medicago truncatula]
MLLQENEQSLIDIKSIPIQNAADMPTFTNKLIVDELNYNKDELEKTHADMLLMLIDEQRYVHEKIMESVGSNDDGFFFLYGYSGGRTAHSTLTVPVEIMRNHLLRWKRIVLGQTWQMLPVVRKGTRQDIVDASINSSKIWAYFNVLRLTVNMRLGASLVEIPEDLLISDATNLLISLTDFVYLDLNDNLGDPLFFQERGILAPTLDSWFTTEFPNDIKSSGIPNHRLKLKVGCPVMLMRNIDRANGLCNGTRLTVTHLGKSMIAATVITGKRAGTNVFIPRMNLIPSDPGLPFKFMRRQFPLTFYFAMTINKSQGQSLSRV